MEKVVQNIGIDTLRREYYSAEQLSKIYNFIHVFIQHNLTNLIPT